MLSLLNQDSIKHDLSWLWVAHWFAGHNSQISTFRRISFIRNFFDKNFGRSEEDISTSLASDKWISLLYPVHRKYVDYI